MQHDMVRSSHIQFCIEKSDLGYVLLAETCSGVCAVYMADTPAPLKTDLYRTFPAACLLEVPQLANLNKVIQQIAHPKNLFTIPIDESGTAFQRKVWAIVREIPLGKTMSYRDIAIRMGKPTASRAVANACAANHIAIVTPCHRVVRQDNQVSGYRWGLARKQYLLAKEQDVLFSTTVHGGVDLSIGLS